jgi:hypothetical protein
MKCGCGNPNCKVEVSVDVQGRSICFYDEDGNKIRMPVKNQAALAVHINKLITLRGALIDDEKIGR